MSVRGGRRLARAFGNLLILILAAAAPAWAQTEIHIEGPVASTSVTQPLAIGGWAVDQTAPTGTGVDLAYIYYCASPCTGSNFVFLAPAQYGNPRPDVGAALGARFMNSQFWLIVTGLAPGLYDFVVYAHSTGTNTWSAQGVSGVTLLPSPVLSIEGPAPQQSITTPFTLSGWAADFAAPTGTGIDQVVAAAFPNPGSGVAPLAMPAASVGNARTDVEGAAYNARFRPTGWTLALPSGVLPASEYLVAVYAHDTVTNGWIVGTRLAYVDAPQVPLIVDRSGGGTGAITSSPTGLSCAGGVGTQGLPCGATYLQTSATPVTLTATADVGATFTGWSGACTGTGTCQVTMSQAQYVVATFTGTSTPTYQTTYYHQDPLGSVRAITDATGQSVATHTYAPFGEDPAPATGDPNRFTGQELDPETALHYFGARYYRNTIGRFTSVDPIGGNPFAPQTWNAYAYAKNGPLTFIDPNGLQAKKNCGPGADTDIPQDCGFKDSVDVSAHPNLGRFVFLLFDWDFKDVLTPYAIDTAHWFSNVTTILARLANIPKKEPPAAPPPLLPPAPPPPSTEPPTGPNGPTGPGFSPGMKTPFKFTTGGTNHCGPGGSGPLKNVTDGGCYLHDNDWGYLGLRGFASFGWGSLNPDTYRLMKASNIRLCSTAVASGETVGLAVALYFSVIPVGSCLPNRF